MWLALLQGMRYSSEENTPMEYMSKSTVYHIVTNATEKSKEGKGSWVLGAGVTILNRVVKEGLMEKVTF